MNVTFFLVWTSSVLLIFQHVSMELDRGGGRLRGRGDEAKEASHALNVSKATLFFPRPSSLLGHSSLNHSPTALGIFLMDGLMISIVL